MGYFSEMSLDMQEGRKPSAASLTRECAFEDGENFDELPVPPADRQPVPPAAEPAPQSAFEDDGDLDEAPEELEQPDEAGPPAEETDDGDNADLINFFNNRIHVRSLLLGVNKRSALWNRVPLSC